jgi:hypothetical protein
MFTFREHVQIMNEIRPIEGVFTIFDCSRTVNDI